MENSLSLHFSARVDRMDWYIAVSSQNRIQHSTMLPASLHPPSLSLQKYVVASRVCLILSEHLFQKEMRGPICVTPWKAWYTSLVQNVACERWRSCHCQLGLCYPHVACWYLSSLVSCQLETQGAHPFSHRGPKGISQSLQPHKWCLLNGFLQWDRTKICLDTETFFFLGWGDRTRKYTPQMFEECNLVWEVLH